MTEPTSSSLSPEEIITQTVNNFLENTTDPLTIKQLQDLADCLLENLDYVNNAIELTDDLPSQSKLVLEEYDESIERFL